MRIVISVFIVPGSASNVGQLAELHSRVSSGTKETRAKRDRKLINVKFHECDICHKVLSVKSSIRDHLATHTGDKRHTCAACGRKFTQKSHLLAHASTHSGEKPYACLDCGLQFARKGTLKCHARRHTGERPYACRLCPATFSRTTVLSKHSTRNQDQIVVIRGAQVHIVAA
ncbi:hypothetical protein HPB49_001192 [Dermacentor silvarum]|uniref:Uncharacterized protein n=1 Tax=Dermacentor silvarum TaxID=543639 RepID=A0ACB8DHN3_DERSI|nr:hypothetical protein HPB49_001192 [Dermacentor silvarum]